MPLYSTYCYLFACVSVCGFMSLHTSCCCYTYIYTHCRYMYIFLLSYSHELPFMLICRHKSVQFSHLSLYPFYVCIYVQTLLVVIAHDYSLSSPIRHCQLMSYVLIYLRLYDLLLNMTCYHWRLVCLIVNLTCSCICYCTIFCS